MIMRFAGSVAEVGGKRFDRFGQVVELPEDLIRDAMLGGVALVTPEDFEIAGFTPEELKNFSVPSTHERAPAEFVEKKKLVVAAYCDALEKLKEV
jgi:hypothetical protein